MRWLRGIDEAFREEGKPIEFVLVSFDWRNDTPKNLAKFRKREELDPERWHLNTGEPLHVDLLANWMGLSYQDLGNHMLHGTKILLLDSDGLIVSSNTRGNNNVLAWLRDQRQNTGSPDLR